MALLLWCRLADHAMKRSNDHSIVLAFEGPGWIWLARWLRARISSFCIHSTSVRCHASIRRAKDGSSDTEMLIRVF